MFLKWQSRGSCRRDPQRCNISFWRSIRERKILCIPYLFVCQCLIIWVTVSRPFGSVIAKNGAGVGPLWNVHFLRRRERVTSIFMACLIKEQLQKQSSILGKNCGFSDALQGKWGVRNRTEDQTDFTSKVLPISFSSAHSAYECARFGNVFSELQEYIVKKIPGPSVMA